MQPEDVKQADVLAHFHSQTNARQHEQQGPLMITRGDGVWVEDIDGNRYLESMSGLWFASLGFSHPALIEAAYRQMQKLPCYHTFNQRSNDACALLAQTLQTLVPMQSARIFFVNSGSEANDTMVKLAWYYHDAQGHPGKRKILTRRDAFHGSSVFGAALSGLPHMHHGFYTMNENKMDDNAMANEGIVMLSAAHYYRDARNDESEVQYTDRLVDELEQAIQREGADTIAAMIAEPIMGAGGVAMPPTGYFEKIGKLLRQHNILLLADEVICGFGRTGEWFGSQTFQMRPDMMAMAKGLSSGYQPIGAVAISDEVYQCVAHQSASLGVFGHGHTYSGHPVAAAVALEAIRQYQAMDAPTLVRQKGEVLNAYLAPLREHSLVGDVRSIGLIAGIELVMNKDKRTPFPASLAVGKQVEEHAREAGLIIRNMGDTIALCPPFIITDAELELLQIHLLQALDKTQVAILRS